MDGFVHVLIVDDHQDIRDGIRSYLETKGMRVSVADSVADARKKLATAEISIVVLDVMMPGESGLSLCRWLVENSGPPVILLTAMADAMDRIIGLEIGADDYLTKPFDPRELLARIRAVLRRTKVAQPVPSTNKKLGFDGLVLDPGRRELTDRAGCTVALSGSEFALLYALVTRAGVVLSRDQLLDLTKGRGAVPFDRAIDNLILRLRKKVEVDPGKPSLIKTVWGRGYTLAARVEAEA